MSKNLHNFWRFPAKFLVSNTFTLAGIHEDCIFQTISEDEFQDFPLDVLARYYLQVEELPIYKDLKKDSVRQKEWLMGRIVAKDAARLWMARKGNGELRHPAAITIGKSVQGQPYIRSVGKNKRVPNISISHSGSRAVAIAHEAEVGIDLEEISERSESFFEAISNSRERKRFKNIPNIDRDVLLTRLWCAKEAVGKDLR